MNCPHNKCVIYDLNKIIWFQIEQIEDMYFC